MRAVTARSRISSGCATTNNGQFAVRAPDTDLARGGQAGFGKSVAFLIQPAGLTPNKTFQPVPSFPDHVIGQIVCTNRRRWHEERQEAYVGRVWFDARTKPPIPQQDRETKYYYEWQFGNDPPQGAVGAYSKYHDYPNAIPETSVSVTIKENNAQGKRVTGDLITLEVFDLP